MGYAEAPARRKMVEGGHRGRAPPLRGTQRQVDKERHLVYGGWDVRRLHRGQSLLWSCPKDLFQDGFYRI